MASRPITDLADSHSFTIPRLVIIPHLPPSDHKLHMALATALLHPLHLLTQLHGEALANELAIDLPLSLKHDTRIPATDRSLDSPLCVSRYPSARWRLAIQRSFMTANTDDVVPIVATSCCSSDVAWQRRLAIWSVILKPGEEKLEIVPDLSRLVVAAVCLTCENSDVCLVGQLGNPLQKMNRTAYPSRSTKCLNILLELSNALVQVIRIVRADIDEHALPENLTKILSAMEVVSDVAREIKPHRWPVVDSIGVYLAGHLVPWLACVSVELRAHVGRNTNLERIAVQSLRAEDSVPCTVAVSIRNIRHTGGMRTPTVGMTARKYRTSIPNGSRPGQSRERLRYRF